MKISILTTITNPDERQDKWREALTCYKEFADEVVVVNGGDDKGDLFLLKDEPDYFTHVERIKVVHLPWPYEWNWIELPKHLNAGLEQCTGDWVIKLDIDQFIHEKDFRTLRAKLRTCPRDCDVATFQKMSMTYGKKYYQKGGQPIAFRRRDYIKFGQNIEKETDLCFPIDIRVFRDEIYGEAMIDNYLLPVGETPLKSFKTGISYWNYDYFFKTKEFTKKEFFRFSRAYHRYFKKWTFGRTERKAFDVFLKMMKGRHDRAPYTYELKDHPKHIREAVRNLAKDQFGLSAWGLL